MERPEWLDDPRFQNSEGLDLHKHARLELTQEALRERTSAEWIERLEAEGVPCAPVLTRREAIRHPQAVANGIVMESDHPVAGRLRQARPPAVFSATPPDHRFGAPELGGHTRAILSAAGYDDAAIDAMIENGSAAETKTRSEDAA